MTTFLWTPGLDLFWGCTLHFWCNCWSVTALCDTGGACHSGVLCIPMGCGVPCPERRLVMVLLRYVATSQGMTFRAYYLSVSHVKMGRMKERWRIGHLATHFRRIPFLKTSKNSLNYILNSTWEIIRIQPGNIFGRNVLTRRSTNIFFTTCNLAIVNSLRVVTVTFLGFVLFCLR